MLFWREKNTNESLHVISKEDPSPMVDNGYNISDYKGIDPSYGTMEANGEGGSW